VIGSISVVVPAFDAEPHLREALESVAAQSRPPDEIVVVDDGSRDRTMEVAQSFARAHADIDVVIERTDRCGAASARNHGAAIATGQALMFLDADDVLDPMVLEALLTQLHDRPDAVAIGPWCRLEPHGTSWRRRPASCAPRRPGDDPLAAWLRGWYHPPCAVMWTRQAFERAGRWDESCRQNDDGDLMMRAFVHGVPLVETAQGCSAYRRPEPERSTLSDQRTRPDGLVDRLRVVTKIAALVEDAGLLPRYRPPLRDALADIARDADARPATQHIARLARAHRRMLLPLPDRLVGIVSARSSERRVPGKGHGSTDVTVPRPLERAADESTAHGRCGNGPAVSVVIPTFERAGLVGRAVHSVLAQTFDDVEVLVVDDASTDDTADVVGAIGDPRIRYVRQSVNAGAGAARNRGIHESRGRYIAFLDSDDIWLPCKLERQVALLDVAPAAVGLVYGGTEVEHATGEVTTSCPHERGDLHRRLLERNVVHGGGSNAMIRRSVVASAGFFDERFDAIEDHDYWVRIARMYDVDFVDAPVVRYHDVDGDERRSRHVASNMASRRRFADKHRRQMRRRGAAAPYHLDSARRHLRAGDRRAARRAAWQAVAADPLCTEAWNRALRLSAPAAVGATRRRWTDRRGNDARSATDPMQPVRRGSPVLMYSCTSPAEVGGTQRVFDDLVRRLRDDGHQVVELRSGGGDDRNDITLAVPDSRRGRRAPSIRATITSTLRLAAILAKHRPEVVNVHFLYPPDLIHFIALRPIFRYRLVFTAHGSDVLRPVGPKAQHLPTLLRRADALTSVSTTLTERMANLSGVERSDILTIPNEIDLDYWRRNGTEASGSVLLAVGRLTDVKGFDVLLDALPAVRSVVPDVRLVLVGDGVERDRLLRQAHRLGIDDCVEATGVLSRADVRSRMRQAHVFVMPSRSEGMPLVLLEAMATGLAPVATAVGGIPQIIGPGVLIPADDADATAAAITDLLCDRPRLRTLQLESRAHVEELLGRRRGPTYDDALFPKTAGTDRSVPVG